MESRVLKLPRARWVRWVASFLALVAGYVVLRWLGIDANAIAAVAGALAAFAALGAASESSQTARQATEALALALKPDPYIRLEPGERMSSAETEQQFTLEIENVSQNPGRLIEIRWRLRDGTAGSQGPASFGGRTTPVGLGFLHAPGPTITIDLGTCDASKTGTDEVEVAFTDAQGLRRWRRRRWWMYEDAGPGVAPRIQRTAGRLEADEPL